MRDERIRGLKIHEETQEEAKIKGKNLKTIILLTAPGRLVDAQIQTHKKNLHVGHETVLSEEMLHFKRKSHF